MATISADAPRIGAPFRDSPVVAQDASLIRVAGGFDFTEGPACATNGDVYFTDQPNNRIHHWSAETGEVSLFMEPCGRANGLFVAPDGKLIACADENTELWVIDLSTKAHRVLADNFAGKPLNGPNDVWVHPSGANYFTDPFYSRSYRNWDKAPQQRQNVYLQRRGAGEVICVVDELIKPNGIIGTAIGDRLFVSDIDGDAIYQFRIEDDGRLTQKKKIIDRGSDGMTLDDKGNLYLTGDGVTVFDADGKQVEHIPVPEKWTGNICFAGTQRSTLFITASHSVYTIDMKIMGQK